MGAMGGVTAEQLVDDLDRLLHRSHDVREFSRGAARALARAVPFDGSCVVTIDPATSLPTGEFIENGLPEQASARMAENEIQGHDFNRFTTLGRSDEHAAGLSVATGGDLNLSERHRELKQPHGFGDELRVALVTDSAMWGGMTLLRAADREPFTPTDAALVSSVSRYLAEGLRRAMLHAALLGVSHEHEESVGLLLMASDNSIIHADDAAERWLTELRESEPDTHVPAVVRAVAALARIIVGGQHPSSTVMARARVSTTSGTLLLVRGSTLGDGDDAQTAVIIEPARPHDLAPLIADAFALTERERAVTQLVAQGLSTNAIGARLHISPWTVQDHLKSIFEKVDVDTRGELVSRVFFKHYVPRLVDGSTVGSDGFFRPPS